MQSILSAFERDTLTSMNYRRGFQRIYAVFAASIVIASLFAARVIAQTESRGKSHTLHGTVEGINDFAQSIRVKQEKIEGYSDARIATYNVDDAAILKKLEIGDRIAATIYEKDDTLYDVRIAQINDTNPVPIRKPRPTR